MTDLHILVITIGVVITLAGYLVLCDRVKS